MSKSIKRFKKYNEEYEDEYSQEDHGKRLKEKHIRTALRSNDISALLNLEDYE